MVCFSASKAPNPSTFTLSFLTNFVDLLKKTEKIYYNAIVSYGGAVSMSTATQLITSSHIRL